MATRGGHDRSVGDPSGRARALVLAHGWQANAYQILNPGISHWFSTQREAVVGYVRHGRFLVVAGAPVCDERDLADVADELHDEASRDGLGVCYFGCQDPVAAQLANRPASSLLRLGAQPAWDPALWTEGVKGHASLRAQLHRALNKGVVVRELSSRDAALHPAMQRCVAQWLATRGAPPMHFLVEPHILGLVGDRRIFVAERLGSLVAFLVASPVPRREGWLVEQVIRGSGAVNGTSELLVDRAMRSLAEDGSRYVTLGLSPLSRQGDEGSGAAAPWLRLVLGWLRAHGRRFYNFEGLDAFKAKLRPGEWEAVYAVADRSSFSPAVLHAIAGAFTAGTPLTATLRALGSAAGQELRTLRARRPRAVDPLRRSE